MEPPYRAGRSVDTTLAKSSHRPRWSGWISFSVLMALPLLSFGGCVATCSATEGKKPWREVGPIGGWLVVAIGVSLTLWALGSFLLAGRRSAWVRRSDAVGVALAAMLGPGSTIGSAIWWFLDGSSLGGLGGGWGRPLRVGGRDLSPVLAHDAAFPKGPRPDVTSLSAEERALLGDMSTHDTRKEWASVPAFSQVAWHLAAVGAPPELVHRALVSAQQEIDHARRCSALASSFLGEALGPQPMPELSRGCDALPTDLHEALCALAEDSLIDGAWVEDYNAELAAAALPETTDPAARVTLERIVRDERMHAELGWDIVAYCLQRGGPPMREHLRKAWGRVPTSAPAPYGALIAERVAKVRAEVLHAFGRVRPEHWVSVHAARRSVLEARLLRLLGDDVARAA